MFRFFNNQKGLSLVEVVVAAGLVSLVVGLSVSPLIEIKKLERRVEFQSGLDISHQLAMQKARNPEFIKKHLGIEPGSPQEKCFAGRGVSCHSYHTAGNNGSPAPAPADTFTSSNANGFTAQSKIFVTAACAGGSCSRVDVAVSTIQTAGNTQVGWVGRPLAASFSIPASALAGRVEINFAPCATKLRTGVDYGILTANCTPSTEVDTCAGLTAGPVYNFGRTGAQTLADCQAAVNMTCASGMDFVGLSGGQAVCAPPMTCSDPMSATCTPPTPPPGPCTPNWQPAPATVCDGAAFTQTDANACPTSVSQPAVGTNPAICPVISCALPAGPLRWPNPTTGPCGVASAAGTAAGGGTTVVMNEQAGYAGSFTATCVDNSPAVSTFDMAGATQTCSPVVCAGVPATIEWSSTGVKSGMAGPGLDAVGPWACSGNLTIIQATAQPPGNLVTTQVEAAARAAAVNSNAQASAGSVSATCTDPGPATAARSGVLNFGPAACSPIAATPTPGPTPYCEYSCIDNFVQGASGQMNAGEQSQDLCLHHPMNLPKFSMGCTTFNGASCYLTNPGGGGTYAMCAAPPVPVPTPTPVPTPGPTPVPTPVPTPACQADGYTTGAWGGADDTLCTAASSFGGGITTLPYALCCSGQHTPTYGFADTVGGGNCYWRCGGAGPGPGPMPTPAPTPAQACNDYVAGQGCPGRCFGWANNGTNPGPLLCASGNSTYWPGGHDITACPQASWSGTTPAPMSNQGKGTFTGMCL